MAGERGGQQPCPHKHKPAGQSHPPRHRAIRMREPDERSPCGMTGRLCGARSATLQLRPAAMAAGKAGLA
jgi:hypothetical protein